MSIDRDVKLLTAQEVASLCEVDLKTIHNWVDRGCIPHFRTPGRHLRFRAADVVRFLRSLGYTVPGRLLARLVPMVLVVGGPQAVAMVGRAVGQSAAVENTGDLVDAAIRVGIEPTWCVVVQDDLVHACPDGFVRMVEAIERMFRVSVFVLGEDSSAIACRVDVVFVPMGDSKLLRAAMAGLMDRR